MPNFYYTDATGAKQGPVNEQQLQALVSQRIITPQTQLETEAGHKGFAGQIPGLNFQTVKDLPNSPLSTTVQHNSSSEQHPLLTLEGIGGCWLEVYSDKIVYTRSFSLTFQGLMQFIFHGIKGNRTYFYHRITSLEFRKGKILTYGYLRLFTGGNEAAFGGILPFVSIFSGFTNESTIRFGRSQNELVQKIYEIIESRIILNSASKHP